MALVLVHEHTLDEAKAAYLTTFVRLRLADIADAIQTDGNLDGANLLLFYVAQTLPGVIASEQGIVEYWRSLRNFETAREAAGILA